MSSFTDSKDMTRGR